MTRGPLLRERSTSMAQDIAYKNFEQPSNQEEQATQQEAKKPTNLTLEGYWKTKQRKTRKNWVKW